MLKIDIGGHRISGSGTDVTLSELREVKLSTKTHTAGDLVEHGHKYYPSVSSAVRALALTLAAGGDSVEVTSLGEYVRRIEDFELRVTEAIDGKAAG